MANTLKPDFESRMEKKVAELHEAGHLSNSEIGDFIYTLSELRRLKALPEPEMIKFEVDLPPKEVYFPGGLQMIQVPESHHKAQMKTAMEELTGDLVKYLLVNGFVSIIQFTKPGSKPKLRGHLFVIKPPQIKNEPFVKPKG